MLGNNSEQQQTAHITIGSWELEQGIGRQWATVLGTKFYGAGTSGAPGSGPGGEYLRQQLGGIFTPQTAVTMAVYPSSGPDIVRSGSSAGRENTEGRCGPAGRRAHQYCFGFICQRQRPTKRGHRPGFLKGSHEPTVQNHLEMATIFG
jgi:hypothetical protein